MVRLYLLLGVVVVAFYIFSIVDCALYDRMRVRALPKPAWVLIVLIPVIGGLLWFAFGRAGKGANAGARPMAPDDDPEFLGSLGRNNRDNDLQDRIHRLEQELSDLGNDSGPEGKGEAKPEPQDDQRDTRDARDARDVRKNSKGRDSDPKPGHPDA